MNGTPPITVTHPEVVASWHPTKNGDLRPEMVTAGSNLMVWWRWPCGHEKAQRPKTQTKTKGCPFCRNVDAQKRRALQKKKQTGLLSEAHYSWLKEWSSTNTTSPSDYSVAAYAWVNWDCSVCSYTWSSCIAERVKGKGNCFACSGRVFVPGNNDLKSRRPALASEWSKKNEKAADEVVYNSTEKAWWTCKASHEWRATPRRRLQEDPGCPTCHGRGLRRGTSEGQREVMAFLESLGEECQEGVKLPGRLELDVYLPKRALAVEYNGNYWHSDGMTMKRWGITAQERHQRKVEACEAAGVLLLYVWEEDWTQERTQVEDALRKAVATRKAPPLLSRLSREDTAEAKRAQAPRKREVETRQKARPLTPAEVDIVVERYMKGEAATAIARDLHLRKENVISYLHAHGLVEERIRRGFTKNGAKCLPADRESEFVKIYEEGAAMGHLMEKYDLNYATVRATIARLCPSSR